MSIPFSKWATTTTTREGWKEKVKGKGVRTGLGRGRDLRRSGGGDGGVRAGDLPLGDASLGGGLLGGGESLGGGLSLLLALDLFRVAVLRRRRRRNRQRERTRDQKGGAKTHEEHVDHDGPGVRGARDRAADAEDLTAEEPPDETDRVLRLVVGRDGNVDVVEGRVGVADGDDGDVDVRRLADGLVVDARVGDDNQARLLERAGDVVGEVARGEAAGDGLRASVGRKLEDGTVTVRAGRDDADVVRVLDRGDDTRGEDNLLPGLANVDDVDAYIERVSVPKVKSSVRGGD